MSTKVENTDKPIELLLEQIEAENARQFRQNLILMAIGIIIGIIWVGFDGAYTELCIAGLLFGVLFGGLIGGILAVFNILRYI